MKPQVYGALIAALAVVALGLLLSGRPAPLPKADAPVPERQLTVTGEGVVRARADTAAVTLLVRSDGPTARDATALNAAAVDRVAGTLAALQVAPEDIRAGRGEVRSLVAQDILNPGRTTGYRAESRVVAVVHNLRNLNKILEGATDAGATEVLGVVYSLAQAETARQEAIRAAMDNAAQRAAVLALAGGNKLKDLVSATAQILEEDPAQGAASPAPGEFLIRVRVTATYQL